MNPLGRFVVRCATLGPLGSLPAPGTWGSAAGVALYAVVFHGYNTASRAGIYAALCLVLILAAVVFCGMAEHFLKRKDPGCIILDEFVAMPLVFAGFHHELATARHAWVWYLAGFGLFRLFDIAKPFGIRRIQSLKGGLGVVVDDLLAAVYACGALHAARLLVEWGR